MQLLATEAPFWQRWAVRTYLMIRVSTLGFTLMLPLAGSLSAAPGWRPAQAVWLMAMALFFHIFAYVLNDIIDLNIDRSEPLRADSPLVREEVSRGLALLLVWLQPPLAFGMALMGKASASMLAWLAIGFTAMAVYDVCGKRCRWPLVTDAVQAVGWCALLLMGALGANSPLTPATWWLAGYVFLCVLLVNGVHGGLRDLANDLHCGARTTALWLGARPGASDTILPSRALVLHALVLQTGMAACAVGAAMTIGDGAIRSRALPPVLAMLVAAGATLLAAFRCTHNRRSLVRGGALNIVATVLVLPASVWSLVDSTGKAVLLAINVLPIVAMWAYNGSHWCLASNKEGQT